jgi:ATP-dependent Clp protease ATP-binding subunit ClpC
MSYLQLEFPVLVNTRKHGYVVRPLFLAEPQAQDAKFALAVHKLQRQVLRRLDYTSLSRDNMHEMLWYKFYPGDLHFEKMELEFMAGQRPVVGKFCVVWFDMMSERVVCLPDFANFFFIAERAGDGSLPLATRVIEAIQHLLREERHKSGNDVNPEKYMAGDGETITSLSFGIELRRSKLPWEHDENSFFTSLFGSAEEFDGAWEIRKVGADMNQLYPAQLARAFYRNDLVERVEQIIYNKEIVPLVLVGPRGVGKTCVIHEVIYRYLEKNEHKESSKLEKIWHVDPLRVIAGMSIVGRWQSRWEAILEYAVHPHKERNRGDKVYFDNMVALMRVGKSAHSQLRLSDVLKPYLEKRLLGVLAEATPQEWKVVQEQDRRFADMFQVIRVAEPDAATTTRMVIQSRANLEQEKECAVSAHALAQIFALQRTYLRHLAMPGAVIGILRQITNKYKKNKVDVAEVHGEFTAMTQMQSRIFDRTVRLEAREVNESLSSELVGQQEAVDTLCQAILLAKAGVQDPEKPLATFLFIGPTGVGKTQAAKIVARYIYSEDSLLRFDMNEFGDMSAVRRLIGDFERPEGVLTGKIRHRPFCVLLFDEIEKAHPEVHDLLLQILGEGRFTDALGRTSDFTNALIILTSNLGAQEATQKIGFSDSKEAEAAIYQKAVDHFFRPEFLNRLDKIVVFHRLELTHVMQIARLQISELLQRDGFVRRMTILNVSPQALAHVARLGFDPQLGGRALKRRIEKDLTAVTASQMVTLACERPLLFDIFLCDEHLLPRLTPLYETTLQKKIMPVMPAMQELRSYYEKLWHSVESMEQSLEAIQKMTDSTAASREKMTPVAGHWQFYWFKTELLSLKDTLQKALWGIDEAEHDITAVFSPKVRVGFHNYMDNRTDQDYFRDLYAQLAVREYLQDLYIRSPQLLHESQHQYFHLFLHTAYLQFFQKSLLTQRNEKVLFHVRACVENCGKREIAYLQDVYLRLLDLLGMPVDNACEADDNARLWVAHGLRVYDLFHGEAGIHLFYVPYAAPVPVQVRIVRLPDEMAASDFMTMQRKALTLWQERLTHSQATLSADPYAPLGQILRMYVLPYDRGREDTVTDLRTGTMNRTTMSLDDWRYLLYNGFPAEEKIE